MSRSTKKHPHSANQLRPEGQSRPEDGRQPENQLPSTSSFLEKLRGFGTPKPLVDPELAGGLRDWLDDSLAAPVATLPPGSRAIRIDKDVIATATPTGRPRTTALEELILPRLVSVLFRQWITIGRFEDPLADALAGIAASGDPEGTIELVSRLSADRRREMERQISNQAKGIAKSWPPLSGWWYPRTQERIAIPLCGGRIVVEGLPDLVLGTQATKEATVCLVELDTRLDPSTPPAHLGYYALLETLRSGAPPARVAVFNSRSNELRVKTVDEHFLVGALLHLVEVVTSRCHEQAARVGRSLGENAIAAGPGETR